jgi:hypothetical protein
MNEDVLVNALRGAPEEESLEELSERWKLHWVADTEWTPSLTNGPSTSPRGESLRQPWNRERAALQDCIFGEEQGARNNSRPRGADMKEGKSVLVGGTHVRKNSPRNDWRSDATGFCE